MPSDLHQDLKINIDRLMSRIFALGKKERSQVAVCRVWPFPMMTVKGVISSLAG